MQVNIIIACRLFALRTSGSTGASFSFVVGSILLFTPCESLLWKPQAPHREGLPLCL